MQDFRGWLGDLSFLPPPLEATGEPEVEEPVVH